MDLDEAMDLGYQVLSETGLDEAGWTFEFDNAERRFGHCTYGPKLITMSAPIVSLNDRETVLECLLHEAAHAMAGHAAGHGYDFVMQARALGISGDRCYDSEKVTTNTPPWRGKCPECGQVVRRWRLTKKAQGQACARCCNEYNSGRYSSGYQFQWTRDG